MVGISLGNIVKQNGRTTISGSESGLDTTQLIDAILESKKLEVTSFEDKVKVNDSKVSEVSKLKSLLTKFKSATNYLRNPPGVNNQSDNFFSYRNTSVTSNTSVTGSSYLNIIATPGATVSNYEIKDVVTAKEHILRKDNFTSDTTSVVDSGDNSLTFSVGDFNLNGTTISLTAGDSLRNIESKINSVSDLTGVKATVIKVADGNFSLSLKSSKTGVDNKIAEYGDGDVGDPANGKLKFGANEVSFTQIQQAGNASFKLDGLSVTRSNNAITDVVKNVTFNLVSDTPDSNTKISASIAADTNIAKAGINDFITAYNDLKYFISKNKEIDAAGNYTEKAVLGGESIIQDVINKVETQISSSVKGLTSGASSLFSVGISFIDFPGNEDQVATPGILVLDEDKFNQAVTSDFEQVKNVFSYNFSSDSPNLSVYKRSNDVSLTDFKVDIDKNRSSGNQVRILDLNGNFLFNAAYDPSLNSIKGLDGTSLEGLQLVYTGDGTDLITVNATQGIADKLYNALDSMLYDKTGLIDYTSQNFVDDNESINNQIEEANSRIDQDREFLIARFAALEEAISNANSILTMLQSQADERLSSSR